MNLLEAVRADRPFRRPCHDDWIVRNVGEGVLKPNDKHLGFNATDSFTGKEINLILTVELARVSPFLWESRDRHVVFTPESILAEDWEVR